ncbi:MAG: ABC-F family ATP-binding cassette domain-containing protein [Firmicutes bacterium]|nr:ABC-F family ATP-binding cassette domain-containing protein [Bacillota bacterium]
MSLLSVHQLKKSFGVDTIISDVTFQLQPRERVGLVGANGAGKTTILTIIAGDQRADEGNITFARGTTLGFLEQSSATVATGTMEEELRRAFTFTDQLALQIQQLEQQMATPEKLTSEHLEDIMASYGELRHQFEEAGGYSAEARLRGIVSGLGFQMQDLARLVSTFSGGEQTRLRLARLLLEEPDVLLLDEPTNHLDISAVEWLEKFLCDWSGSVLIVSHDRYFLDRVASRILALESGRVKSYSGNYSAYQAQRELERLTQEKAYAKQQEFIDKEATYIRTSGTGEREKRQTKSRQKRLDKVVALEKPQEAKAMMLDFGFSGRSGEIAVRLEDVEKTFAENPVFSAVNFELHWGDRVALVGPNGSGKSTLLKLIAGELVADAGRVWVGPSVKLVYFDQHQQAISEQTPLEEIMNASQMTLTQARNYLGRFLFSGDDVYKRNLDLSGGEKSRLALAKLGLDDGNFLVLDEPTNHLDIGGVEELEDAIRSFPGTLLVVSHDRYFLERTTTKVLDVDNGRVILYPLPYGDYVQAREKHATQVISPIIESKRQRQEEERLRRDEELQQRRQHRQLKEKVKTIEAEITRNENKIALLEKDLLQPDVFSDYQVAADKGQEMEDIKVELHSLYAQWETLTEQLEKFVHEDKD